MKVTIPRRFRERYNRMVDDRKRFYEYLEKPLPKAFRVNTLKAKTKNVIDRIQQHGITIKKVPWYKDAFVTDEAKIGSTLEHFMGHIYIQELVSMLPPILIKKEIENTSKVFDACASPGSKTTQLSAFMENKGLIVANDIKFERIKILKHNIEKLGCMNVAVTNKDARFIKFGFLFDFVILDAPCSSEGTIRKNWNILTRWSERNIHSLSRIQKQLIINCFDMMKPGGILVYSTCTFAPEENEEVIQCLIEKRNCRLERIKIKGLKTSPAIENWRGIKFNDEIQKTVRIWPHHNNTGGFFLAKIRKVGQ